VISLIVAVADSGAIGINNTLPWRLPNDLQRFKAITMGKPIIMGRKTFDSIGKPLPGRQNIVITRRSDLHLTGCTVVTSVEAALQCARQGDEVNCDEAKDNEVIIIGGAEIYKHALPHAQRIYLTQVHADIQGDAGFPLLNMNEWREVACEHHAADERHAHAYSFVTLERVTS
jgi:dihydrofolate reductase